MHCQTIFFLRTTPLKIAWIAYLICLISELPAEMGSTSHISCAASARATTLKILHRKPLKIIATVQPQVWRFEKYNSNWLTAQPALGYSTKPTEVESRTLGLKPRLRTQKKSEAKAKDSLSEDRPSRDQGQECSRPRPRTKDTATNVLQKKDLQKSFSGNLQFIDVARTFDWGDLNHKSLWRRFEKSANT